jgi:hypothetical protein
VLHLLGDVVRDPLAYVVTLLVRHLLLLSPLGGGGAVGSGDTERRAGVLRPGRQMGLNRG